MLTSIPAYLTLFYSIYFLGHFCMSFAYGLGPPVSTAMAAALCAAVILTLWKASVCAEDNKNAIWGIFAGFFLWCFLGEFLEHERILSLAGPGTALLLVPCLLLIAYVMCRNLLPVGMRFALGHFGCVWLLHAILVNQADTMKNCSPVLHSVSTPALCLAFLLIALFMLVKTIRACSEIARLAFLLPSFIFFWAAMETMQAMDFLPDYTCYAYWSGGNAARSQTHPMEETMDKRIAEMERRYTWKDQQAEKRAYALLKCLPSPHFIDDFTARLERQLQNGRERHLDEKLFYRIMEESFVSTSASAFERLLTACIQQFQAAAVSSRASPPHDTSHPGSASSREDVDEKIAIIKERYTWDSPQTRELAGFMLNRFSILFLTGEDFTNLLDESLDREKAVTLGEELFCRAMKDHFVATCRTVFRNLMKSHVHKRHEIASRRSQ